MSLPIRIQNTLSGRKEVFSPVDPGNVRMYVCGVTPYDECHLGHARCYVFFDTVRRFLKSEGYQVSYVQNFTDIDDKIIQRAQARGEDPGQVAERYIQDYFTQMDRLRILRADVYPRVTQTLPEILAFIQKLMDRGLAYPLDGDVMYSVRKFAGYGKLSKRSLDEMESGARVEVDSRKQDPLDFALWKKAKPGEPAWDSPWGPGRPGWHIECSVMSIQHLGETFDIHGGGQDLIFPHHENEIAQSEGATRQPFARFWLHNGFVTVNREKMSKSLGNFFTLREIFDRYPPEVVRLFLLSRHYRTPLDFSDDLLEQAKSGLQSLNDAYDLAAFVYWNANKSLPAGSHLLEAETHAFREALADDFNTEKALTAIYELRNAMAQKIKAGGPAATLSDWLARAIVTFRALAEEGLGLRLNEPLHGKEWNGDLKRCVEARAAARSEKKWSESDRLRDQIKDLGFVVEDTPWGQRVKKIG